MRLGVTILDKFSCLFLLFYVVYFSPSQLVPYLTPQPYLGLVLEGIGGWNLFLAIVGAYLGTTYLLSPYLGRLSLCPVKRDHYNTLITRRNIQQIAYFRGVVLNVWKKIAHSKMTRLCGYCSLFYHNLLMPQAI